MPCCLTLQSKSDLTHIDHPSDLRDVSLNIDYFTKLRDDSSHTDYLSDFRDSSHTLLESVLQFLHTQIRLSLCVKALWNRSHHLQGHHLEGLPPSLQSSSGEETTWHQPNPCFNHDHSASKPSVCGHLSLRNRLCPVLCIQKSIWLAKGSAGSLKWGQAVLTELFLTLLVILYL